MANLINYKELYELQDKVLDIAYQKVDFNNKYV